MKLMDERRITASAIVTMTVEKTGSPSIGRITTRSMASPSSTAATSAPPVTTNTLPESVVEIVHAM